MGDLQQFFQAHSGQAQRLDDRPGPERLVLAAGQVDRLAGDQVFRRDGGIALVAGRQAGALEDLAAVAAAGVVEHLARFAFSRGGQQRGRLGEAPSGGVSQRGQVRQALADALVHRGHGFPAGLLVSLGVVPADGAGHRPRHPAGVFQCPLLDVEIEGTHSHQEGVDVLALPYRAIGGRDDPRAFLPRLGDLVGQVKGVDARVVPLDVGPEGARQLAGEAGQGVVVQRGAAFVEVADEHAADLPAGDAVVVDQFRGRPLAAPQRGPEGRSGRGHPDGAEEVPGRVQPRDLSARRVAVNAPREHLQDVVRGQRVEVGAGMQHDLAGHAQRVGPVAAAQPAFGRGVLEAGEHLGPHDLAHPVEQAFRPVGGQEVVAGQDDPAYQQAAQPGDVLLPLGDRLAGIARGQRLDPAGAPVGTGDRPPVLPALTGVGEQPAQDRGGSPQPHGAVHRPGRPARHLGQQREDAAGRHAVHRAHPVLPQQPLIRGERAAAAAGSGFSGRRSHCGVPPNRTDRSPAS